MVYIGVALIISSIFFTAWSLVKDKPNPKGIIFLCLCTIFAGIFLIVNERATEIVIKEVGTIKMVVKQVRNDAEEIHNLRTYLDSMFTFGPKGIEPQKAFNVGNLQLTEDGGLMTLVDMNVTSNAADGAIEGYAFKIDANSIMVVKTESDGKGGTKNRKVEFKGNLDILDSDNGVILSSSNGSKWLLKVKNTGELYITKFENRGK